MQGGVYLAGDERRGRKCRASKRMRANLEGPSFASISLIGNDRRVQGTCVFAAPKSVVRTLRTGDQGQRANPRLAYLAREVYLNGLDANVLRS